jgi:hypothetical protein
VIVGVGAVDTEVVTVDTEVVVLGTVVAGVVLADDQM